MNYTIDLPDTDSYNDGSFEIKIGNSGTACVGCDYCWFRMVEIYGTPNCKRMEYYTLDESTGWTEEGYTSYITWNYYDSDLGGYGLYINYDSSISRTISTTDYHSIRIVIGMLSFYIHAD